MELQLLNLKPFMELSNTYKIHFRKQFPILIAYFQLVTITFIYSFDLWPDIAFNSYAR